jgi:hypothetical protein
MKITIAWTLAALLLLRLFWLMHVIDLGALLRFIHGH